MVRLGAQGSWGRPGRHSHTVGVEDIADEAPVEGGAAEGGADEHDAATTNVTSKTAIASDIPRTRPSSRDRSFLLPGAVNADLRSQIYIGTTCT
jgi:hypothetical protein